jgi:DNA-binding NtrC family response regulator
MPNVKALGSRLSCLMAGLFDGSPITTMLQEAGFDVVHKVAAHDTLKALDGETWGVVFLADSLGAPLMRTIIERSSHGDPPAPVVVVGTAQDSAPDAGAMALRLGAADFIAPPITHDVLDSRLRRLILDGPGRAAGSNGTPATQPTGLVARSPAMSKLCESLTRVARYKADVLVVGEAGVGKEQVARALAAMGPRRTEPFITLYCATLGRDVLEDELFGHDRGAASGPPGAGPERKRGLIEMANGGTLFIDDIADLDLATQAKLLRVLERNELRRLGGNTKLRIELNLIAATRSNLEQAVTQRRFRDDLYQRLKGVTLAVPALRDRREDIAPLAQSFLAEFNQRNGGNISGLSPQALERLGEHDWPGNVRELKNTIESAAMLAAGAVIEASDLPDPRPRSEPSLGVATPAGGDLLTIPATATLSEVERLLITEHLRRSRTKADAARSLGMGLRTLYTKIGKFQLTDASRRTHPRSDDDPGNHSDS